MKKELKYTEKEVEKLLSGQRGNCWVALNSLTKDDNLLKSVLDAPEPGHWREKNLYKTPKLEELSYGMDVQVFNTRNKLFVESWPLDTWNETSLDFGVLGNFENLHRLILDKQIRIKI